MSAEEDVKSTESVDSDDESADEPLTHMEAMALVETKLASLIQNDPLLSDLPPEITLEEVNSQIALEYGQAITVNVRRADNVVLSVVVVHDATVLDLKHAIKRHVNLKQAREKGITHISWRYVWRTYYLFFEGQKLSDDNKLIKDYNIRNKSEVTFIKRLRQR